MAFFIGKIMGYLLAFWVGVLISVIFFGATNIEAILYFFEEKGKFKKSENVTTVWGVIRLNINDAGVVEVLKVEKLFDGFSEFSVMYDLKKCNSVSDLKIKIGEFDLKYENLINKGIIAKSELERLKRAAIIGTPVDESIITDREFMDDFEKKMQNAELAQKILLES